MSFWVTTSQLRGWATPNGGRGSRPPRSAFMTLIVRSLRVVLAVLTVALGASALTVLGLPTNGPAAAYTTLPTGWKLCVLQGTGAPATVANVADLDGWQVQEGGSTNNTAAYNPFNT